MSFFDRLKEGIELFTDFRTEMKDLLDEGREIFTDGFKEMVAVYPEISTTVLSGICML